MKKSINYLQLVIHHPDSVLGEFPSRYCVLRISYDSIHVYDSGEYCKISLSEHQIAKLKKISYDSSFTIIGHRPCDLQFLQIKCLISEDIAFNFVRDSFKLALFRAIQ